MNAGHPAPGSPVGSPMMHLMFDEGYGDTAYDSSPQGNDGNVGGSQSCPGSANCPSRSNLGYNKSLDFDGSNDFVSSDTDLDFSEPITVSAWVYPHFANGTGKQAYAKIVSQPTTVNSDPWIIYALDVNNGSPAKFRANISTGATSSTVSTLSTTTLSANTGYHVAFTYNGSQIKIYVNGELENTANTNLSLGTSSEPLVIGAIRDDYLDVDNMFDGLIDNAKIYNFALSDAQIAQEYNRGKSVVFGVTGTDSSGNPSSASAREYCPPGDNSSTCAPIAEWKFDEKSGTSAYDTSANNYTGTLQNTPSWLHKGACHNVSCLELNGSTQHIDIGPGTASVKTA